MNEAISATNVILNVAISPTLLLIPSSLIIFKKPIDGYNNKLKVSSENMVFGINKNLNYYGVSNTKDVKQHNIELKKLENLDQSQKPLDKSQKPLKNNKLQKPLNNFSTSSKNTMKSESFIILSLSIVGGILIARYVL